MLLGILYFENFRLVHQDAAVNLHVVHLGHSLCELSVDRDVCGRAPAVIHPVAVLDHRCGLRSRYQFLLILLFVTHF